MPIRTKDFLLFLLAMMFLVVGGVSLKERTAVFSSQGATLIYGLDDPVVEEVIYQAKLPKIQSDERPSRLKSLQGKIAQLFADDQFENQLPEAEIVLPTEEVVPDRVGEILQCPNFKSVNVAWDSSNIKFAVTEGARILYREVIGTEFNLASSSNTILQLPISSFPGAVKTCLNTDVVGIALDGSLMRNGEDGIYKIFGGETLLGYALDGFPIYGLSNDVATDSCGGTSVDGSYRYYLNDNRAGLIGCFSGSPVSL